MKLDPDVESNTNSVIVVSFAHSYTQLYI